MSRVCPCESLEGIWESGGITTHIVRLVVSFTLGNFAPREGACGAHCEGS